MKQIKKRGISLIVLIITIIVVIILAAVVILTLSKNNPIESAKEARFKEDVRTFQNELSLAVSKEYAIAGGQRDKKITAIKIDSIQKYIPSFKKTYEGKIVIKKDELVYNEEKLDEKELKYFANLNINKNIKTSAEIVEEKFNLFYGKTVNYKSENVEIDNDLKEWKIFYSDGENVYLISSDYVSPFNLPQKEGEILSEGDSINYPKSAKFNLNLLNKYNLGSKYITNEKIKKLNYDYFIANNFSSNKNNMKAVIYMLDIAIWNKFVNNLVAEFVIGGPTIEMLLNSYSQKQNVKYMAKSTSENGYKISKDGGINWSTSYAGMLDKNDNLYVLPAASNSNTGASGMWVSSSSANNGSDLIFVESSGKIGYIKYNNATSLGFRPIVCLNSDVVLKDGTNGYDFNIALQ